MTLYLPKYLVDHRSGPLGSAIPVASFVSWRELSGEEIEVADLVAELATLPRTAVMRIVTWLLNQVGSHDNIAAARQKSLATFMLPPDLLAAYESLAATRKPIAFHSHQLRFLLQMAVICSRNFERAVPEVELRQRVGRACMMVNGLLDEMSIAEPGDTDESRLKWFGTLAIYLRDPTENEVLPQFARAQRLWNDLLKSPELQKIASYRGASVDFENIFVESYGLPLSTFLAVLFAVASAFALQDEKGPMLLDVSQVFPNATDVACAALRLVSTKADALARSLLREPRQGWFSDLTPLMAHPLIEVEPGKYACPDVRALNKRLTEGVYWLLAKSYPGGSDQFKSIFGHIFELYIRDVVSAFTYSAGGLAKSFFRSPKFEGTQDEAADGAIIWFQTFVVFESKAGLLSTRQRYSGDVAVMFQGIDSLFYGQNERTSGKKGVRQLASNVARILAGEAMVSHGQRLPQRSNELLLPAIVTFDEACAVYPIQKYLDRRFRVALSDAGVSDTRSIGPLMLLSMRDVEMLDWLSATVKVEGVLRDYAEHLSASSGLEMNSFHAYVVRQYGGATDNESYVRKAAEDFRRRTLASCTTLGILPPNIDAAAEDDDKAR
jgi:hypothetical protein